MIILGVTGDLGSGKSTVAGMLEKRGAKVLNADLIARMALRKNSLVYPALVREFGKGILNANGSVDRGKLAKIAFSRPEKLKSLNALIHPWLKLNLKMRLQRLERDSKTIAVVDAAVLLEAGMRELVDMLIVVTADIDRKLERVRNRGRITVEQAKQRLRFQITQANKLKYADFVIDNNDGLEFTRKQVDVIWKQLTEKAAHPGRRKTK